MRNFDKIKRIVIKVGTNVLSRNTGVDTDFIGVIASQIAGLVQEGRQVILVTSGAVGMGAGALGLKKQLTEIKMRQACAAVGQGILMREYQDAFKQYGQTVAQVLLTNRIMSYRKNYVNLKNAVETLLKLNVVPIVNENDCVSIEEIDLAFGDNDRLSALVASKIDAELLIVLTDVAGLYNGNPRENPDARLLSVVHEITPEIEVMAGKPGSKYSTGGMAAKLKAIQIAANSGCRVVLADGRRKNIINDIVAGEDIGTLFLPKRRLSNRKRWILNSLPQGRLEIDPGAVNALLNKKSLLQVGITDVIGDFRPGDVIEIGTVAKGVTRLAARDIRRFLDDKLNNSHTPEAKRQVAVHIDHIVLYV